MFVDKSRLAASVGEKKTSSRKRMRSNGMSAWRKPLPGSGVYELSSGLRARFRSSARYAVRFIRCSPFGSVTVGKSDNSKGSSSVTIEKSP